MKSHSEKERKDRDGIQMQMRVNIFKVWQEQLMHPKEHVHIFQHTYNEQQILESEPMTHDQSIEQIVLHPEQDSNQAQTSIIFHPHLQSQLQAFYICHVMLCHIM